jgi:SulP family sulfate permease
MAFAIASGAPPQAGIITAVIAGFCVSALGGTRVCIGGPTGAFIALLYGIALQYGMENLAICTILAGLLLLVMGITRLGSAIKFIPYPVTLGFTSGIAVLIFSSQIRDCLGVRVDTLPSGFLEKMAVLAGHLDTVHGPTLGLAVVSLACIRFWPARWRRWIPGTIAALILGTLAVKLLQLPVETIGSRFGGIPHGLPGFRVPVMEWENVRHLLHPALTIALLAAIESLLCAVVADGMTGDRHDSNQELIAQGLANILSPLFGGIAATSAIARTATNVSSGAQTPVAGLVHAATLLAILLAAAPLAKFIPLATLSAVLINVAVHMGEWHNFKRLSRWPKSDAAVFLSAFILTVVVDLTVAVEIGMVLAAILFIKRVSETTRITAVDQSSETEGASHSLEGRAIPPGVLVYEVSGAFFFGAADKLDAALYRLKQEPEVLILRMRRVMAMDATGLNAIEALHHRLGKRRRQLVLSGVHSQPREVMEKAGFLDRIGRENVCPHIAAALERARRLVEPPTPPKSGV